MKRAFLVTLAVVLVTLGAAACRSAGPVETQRAFGVRMARENLWREAMFRFRRAVELDPSSAEAHSNLAVALEANGDFDAAAREYREAMKLDKSNQFIQKNYSRFVEFTSRNKKREAREPLHQEPAPPKDAAATNPEEKAADTPPAAPDANAPSEPAKPDAAAPGPEPKPTVAAPAETPARPSPPPPPPPAADPDSPNGGAR